MTPARRLLASALLALALPALAADTCSVKATLGGKAFALRHCAAAVYEDSHSVTLVFSDAPFTPKELEDFNLSSAAPDKTADGAPRTELHFAFCPGAGKPEASAAAVKSVETGVDVAGVPLAGRQWVFDLPKDKEMLKIEKLSGSATPGGKLSGRITGGKLSDGVTYAWTADFAVTFPAKSAAGGVGCGN